MLLHWAAVRFLLDSQRAKVHERRASRCFRRVEWADFRLTQRGGWHVLEYHPGQGGGDEPLETIQAAMLELVVPILPHRLSEDWRRVIEHIDILDIPGLRAGRQGSEQGKRSSAETLEEQMEIIKRGKVAYLFERYTDEMQIQTLLLLARGGNLEVTSQMKANLDRWGRARYGEAVWPQRVSDEVPAFVSGHHRHRRGISQPHRIRRRDALRNPAHAIGRRAGVGAQRFRRPRQALQQRLSAPLSRHLGRRPEAARARRAPRSGSMPAKPF